MNKGRVFRGILVATAVAAGPVLYTANGWARLMCGQTTTWAGGAIGCQGSRVAASGVTHPNGQKQLLTELTHKSTCEGGHVNGFAQGYEATSMPVSNCVNFDSTANGSSVATELDGRCNAATHIRMEVRCITGGCVSPCYISPEGMCKCPVQ